MDVALFDKCIKYISGNFQPVLIEDLVCTQDLYSKKNFATIMFDDGYKDNIEYAADILDKYKCKASFYVVTDCINNNLPTWTHILEYRFENTQISAIDLNFDFLSTELQVTQLESKQDRVNYVTKLKPFLKKISHENRDSVMDRVAAAYTDIEIPKLMMDWNDLKELKNAGHVIGSHTVTHGMLGTMTNEAQIRHELLDSAKKIEEKLGHFPVAISYPIGSFNETAKRISQEVGYKMGLAVKQNTYNPAQDGLYEIPRIELYNEPWWKTRLRITHTLENFKSLIRYR